MKHFFALIFILNLLKSSAANFDSLFVAAQKLSHDSARVSLFYHQGMNQRFSDPAFSYRCARQIEKIYGHTKEPGHQALAGTLLGILFYKKGDLSTALFYHRLALDKWKQVSHKKGIAVSQVNLANILTDMKNFGLAENFYLSALEINNELGVQLEVDNCLLNLGAMNYEAKNFQVAKNYFLKALEGAKKRNDMELVATCYNNLADVNTVLGEYEDVIANCENSLKMKEMMENDMEKADTYLTLAMIYLKMKKEPEFLISIHMADSLIERFSYAPARILSLKLRSDFFNEKQDFQRALVYLNRHVELRDSLQKVSQEKSGEDLSFASVPEEHVEEKNKTSFPYLYMNILIIGAIGSGVMLFRNKK